MPGSSYDELAFVGLGDSRGSDDWRPVGLLGRIYDEFQAEERDTVRALLPTSAQLDFLA